MLCVAYEAAPLKAATAAATASLAKTFLYFLLPNVKKNNTISPWQSKNT